MRRIVGLNQWIVYLSADTEITGEQMADTMEKRTGGEWRPSYGHLYPTIKRLQSEGYLSCKKRGHKKYYTATKKGMEFLDRLGALEPQHVFKVSKDLDNNILALEKYVKYVKDNIDIIKDNLPARASLKKILKDMEKIKSSM